MVDHAWAKTHHLSRGEETAWLKVLSPESSVSLQALKVISEELSPHVPEVLHYDAAQRVLLFADHGGSEPGTLTFPQRAKLLEAYARMQAISHSSAVVQAALPSENISSLYDQFLTLLDLARSGEESPKFPGNPFLYFSKNQLSDYAEIFDTASGVLTPLIDAAQALPQTLNHGDLRDANVAILEGGEICLFDWDEAVMGPVGLSLHAQFSGCSATWIALQSDLEPESEFEADTKKLHEIYIDTLVEQGKFDRAQLVAGLPGSVLAGVLRYIVSFAAYPVSCSETRAAIASNVANRLSDVMDLAQHQALQAGEERIMELAYAFHTNSRSERAMELYEDAEIKPRFPQPITTALEEAAPPEVFPAVEFSEQEISSGRLSLLHRNIGVELFRKYGGVMLKNAFSTSLIKECHQRFLKDQAEHQSAIQDGGALQVGNQRFMISLPFEGAFAQPDVYASPLVLPILNKLLGNDAILGSYTAVASMPGSQVQKMHQDNPALFGEKSDLSLPSFCIALIIPMIPLDEETGATRIVKGSHRPGHGDDDEEPLPHQDPTVDLGSCYLMDCRLFHQGMANRSDRVRPIMSLVYQRSWYRDSTNFKQQKPLLISEETFSQMPKESQQLVQWAV